MKPVNDDNLQAFDEAEGVISEMSEGEALRAAAKARKNKLKKGGIAAGLLIASSLLLSACGGRDCVTVRDPGSAGFTNPSSVNPQTYCTTDRTTATSYGRGFYYIGVINGGSSGGGYSSGGGSSSS